MKVLFYSSYVSHESGASHAMRETIRRIATLGVEPVVAIPHCRDSYEMFPRAEFDAVYWPIERPRNTRSLRLQARFFLSVLPTVLRLRRLIRQRQIDIVHFNEITDFLAGLVGRLCGKACVCHVRADGISPLYRRFLIPVLRRVTDVVIVPSKSTAAWIKREDEWLAKKVRLIYDYAFDISTYGEGKSGGAFRKECGFSTDDIVVIQVSKFVAIKGHEDFIRAAHEVLAASKNIRFVIIGGEVPGHEEEAFRIQSLASKLAPTPGLLLVGPRHDLPDIYAACDIAVHCPVFPDTYPTVVLLAMAAGRPIIGSAIGGIPEQIEDGVTGLLVPPGDPSALASAIMALATDASRRKALGTAGRKKMTEEFAPEIQARMLWKVYADTIRGVPPDHKEEARLGHVA